MSRQKGFTLIELMITVAIIGIIAAFAYPSYLKSMERGRRSDAKASLNQYAQALERCYTEYGGYDLSTGNKCAAVTQLESGTQTSQQGYYIITAPVLSTTQFVISAAPVPGGPQNKDTGCTIMNLNNTGVQSSGSTTATTDTNNCW